MRRRYGRALGVLTLICLLCALLVWAGTVPPNINQHRHPGNEEIVTHYDAYVGSEVEIGGTVVQTEPVTLKLTHHRSTRTVTVRDVDQPIEIGDRIVVFGAVQPNNVIISRGTTVRKPWEASYMYVISFLGGLWVLARLVNGWRLDRNRWTINPRESRLWKWHEDA